MLVERWGEEEDEAVAATHEIFLDRRHGARAARWVSGARDDPPGLGDRIDAAFGVRGGAERRPIVKVGAPIPLAIPRLAFERRLERADMQSPRLGALVLPACVGQPRKLPEDGVQKPAEPDALAFPFLADPVHPVIPVSRADQRQAVAPDRQAAVERARAMFEQGPVLCGHPWLEIRLVLPRRESRPVEEGNDLVEESDIAGDFQVVDDRVRQPQQIIGDTGAHAAAGRRMPPVLDVTLDELPRGGPQYLRACDVALRDRERHDVLELIAKAIRATRLIERRARPDATGERLIEQPAVEQHVHRPIRCRHLHRAEHVVPVLHHRAQGLIKVRRAVARDQRPRLFRGRRLTEEKDDLGTASGTQLHRRLQGTARVETGADLA